MAVSQQQLYARRRFFALVAILVIAAVAWGFWPKGTESAPIEQEQTEAQQTQSASVEIADCQPGSVEILARIGDEAGARSSFNTSEKPLIWYEVTNTSPVDCTFNLGSRVTFFTITSGNETYWSSKDCDRSTDIDSTITLKGNQTLVSPKGVWERVRSSGEGCGEGQRAVPAGGASYFLKVEVNGVYSENRVQFLLN